MKRILLGTTMLIGAASLAAAAHAETPRITLGGTSDFQLGVTSEDLDTALRSSAFRTETQLNVKIDAKTDGGLGYGGQIDLMTSANADQDNNLDAINHSWLYTNGSWGRLEMGSTYGVTSTMKVDASSIARATGGIDGDFNYFVNRTGTAFNYAAQTGGTGQVLASPDLFLDYGMGNSSNLLGDESQEAINKVNYYTPRFAGFQAGVSFLFDTTGTDRGIVVSRADNNVGEAENVFLGALSWEGKFDQIGLAAAATGEWGNSESATTNDLRTWNAGAKATFMGFSVAGSYGTYGDSLRLKSIGGDNGTHYWTLGAAYETGPFGASVTWLDSRYDNGTTDNDFSNVAVGVDYKLAPGFTPYAEVNFIQIDPTGTANDNDATVFIAGSTLSF
jgi:hypothetical protein